MLDATLGTLLGQPEVSAFLRGLVSRGRYANAYLFHGPPGVGKCTAALAFARAALCERVPGAAAADAGPLLFDAAPANGPAFGDDACGERSEERRVGKECRSRWSQTLAKTDSAKER